MLIGKQYNTYAVSSDLAAQRFCEFKFLDLELLMLLKSTVLPSDFADLFPGQFELYSVYVFARSGKRSLRGVHKILQVVNGSSF